MPYSAHYGARWPGPNHMDLDDPDKSLQKPSFPSEQHATNSCPDGHTRPLQEPAERAWWADSMRALHPKDCPYFNSPPLASSPTTVTLCPPPDILPAVLAPGDLCPNTQVSLFAPTWTPSSVLGAKGRPALGAHTQRVSNFNLRPRAAQGDGDLLQAGVKGNPPRVLTALLVVCGQQVHLGGLDC